MTDRSKSMEQRPPFLGEMENEPETPLSPDEQALLRQMGGDGTTRREFLAILTAAGMSAVAAESLISNVASAQSPATNLAEGVNGAVETTRVTLRINGEPHELELDNRVTLLDALRERLGLTGTKKGCDHGQCGACTVHVNGERRLSCLTLTAQADGEDVTTIEGLADGDKLHPMQAAFIKHDGYQCGYCTPGQICSAVALLNEVKRGDASHVTQDVTQPVQELTDDEVRERMSGNICRCGAYPKIVAAIQDVHTNGAPRAQTWRFVGQQELAALNVPQRKEAHHDAV